MNNGGDIKVSRCEETADVKHVTAGSFCMVQSVITTAMSFLDMGQNGSSLHVEMKISCVPACVSIKLCFRCLTTCPRGAFTVTAAAWLCRVEPNVMNANDFQPWLPRSNVSFLYLDVLF